MERLSVADKMRNEVRCLNTEHCCSTVCGHVTMSFGTASIVPVRDASPAVLVEAADRMLYQAKEAGRNTVRSCVLGQDNANSPMKLP